MTRITLQHQFKPVCAACKRTPWVGIRLTVTDDKTEAERTAWTCLRHTRATLRLLRGRLLYANARLAALRRKLDDMEEGMS